MPQTPGAFVFDAYGTLLDVNSVVTRAGGGIAGDLDALSRLWRQKQIEFTWLRALMGRYENFWSVSEAALRTALAQLHINAGEERVRKLMDAYLEPALFPDVKAALEELGGSPRAILSNGTPAMLRAAVRAAGIGSHFSHIISVDQVRTYKPSPKVYQLAVDALGLAASEILFVSSNAWDAAGAKAFGFRVCWCNRGGGEMDRLGFEPDFAVASLDRILTDSIIPL